MTAEDIVRRWWPTRSASEIEEIYGISRSTAAFIARRFGLVHAAGTVERLRTKRMDNMEKTALWHQRHAAGVRRREARRRMDLWSKWENKPTRYRYVYATMNRKAQRSRHYLICKRGYKPDPDDTYTLIRTDGTRPARNEDILARRHGFKIIEERQEGE